MEKIRTNELETRIDEVLYYFWDPVGVKHEPDGRAEYRSYVSPILALVKSEAGIEKIAHYLLVLESENMGLNPNRTHAAEKAKILLLHKEAIDDRRA